MESWVNTSLPFPSLPLVFLPKETLSIGSNRKRGFHKIRGVVKMIGWKDHSMQFLTFSLSMSTTRGLPYWLREVENITFRSDNPPFKVFLSQIKNEKPTQAYIHPSLKLMCANLSPFAALHGKLRENDHPKDEGREVVRLTRWPYNPVTGIDLIPEFVRRTCGQN